MYVCMYVLRIYELSTNVTVDIHLCTVCMFDVHMNISTGICLQYAYKAIAHKVNTEVDKAKHT